MDNSEMTNLQRTNDIRENWSALRTSSILMKCIQQSTKDTLLYGQDIFKQLTEFQIKNFLVREVIH